MLYFHQETQRLRQQMVGVEQQLRLVSSPTYSPRDRDKAVAEQSVSEVLVLCTCNI